MAPGLIPLAASQVHRLNSAEHTVNYLKSMTDNGSISARPVFARLLAAADDTLSFVKETCPFIYMGSNMGVCSAFCTLQTPGSMSYCLPCATLHAYTALWERARRKGQHLNVITKQMIAHEPVQASSSTPRNAMVVVKLQQHMAANAHLSRQKGKKLIRLEGVTQKVMELSTFRKARYDSRDDDVPAFVKMLMEANMSGKHLDRSLLLIAVQEQYWIIHELCQYACLYTRAILYHCMLCKRDCMCCGPSICRGLVMQCRRL